MRKIPSFSGLRAFESAARLGSFAAACRELCLTPSAISHQVRSLEKHFGQSLFLRRNRRLELTPNGARLLVGLSNAFDTLEIACAELGAPPRQHLLGVHCAPSFASKWLGPRLPAFMQQNPAVNIRLSSSAEPTDLARSDVFDFAITYGAPLDGSGVIAEPLGEEDVVALCTPRINDAFDPQDCGAAARLTLIESTVNPIRWTDWFALNGLTMPTRDAGPSFDRAALAISAAVQGVGVALESRRFAFDELAKGDLVELGGGRLRGLKRNLHFLAYRAAQKDATMVAAFRAWLVATLEDTPPQMLEGAQLENPLA